MTTAEKTVVDALLERVSALEARFAARDAETAEDRANREARNDEAAWIARQRERPVVDPRERERYDLRAVQTKLRPWREWLLRIDAELRAELAALGDEEPRGNDIVWRRTREDLLDTLAQVRDGVGAQPAGNLYALADRDGMRAQLVDSSHPRGLRRVDARLAEIDAALEELSK